MKVADLNYSPNPIDKLRERSDNIMRYLALTAEFGHSAEAAQLLAEIQNSLDEYLRQLSCLAREPIPDEDEPEDLASIRSKRPKGHRRLSQTVPDDYVKDLRGSLLGRCAGCTLGAAVEFQSVEHIEAWGRYFGDPHPPIDYYQRVPEPEKHRYIVGRMRDTTRGRMSFVPADDDTAYTLIGLLTVEAFGPDFTREQQARLWTKNITLTSTSNGSWGAYWGERKLLQNLESGLAPTEAGYSNNPNVQSIAAWTRADTWGYLAPGWPEKAAELAFKDSSINHRRNGVYGSMFFAAAISAAFVVSDPVEALRIGLEEIPQSCLLAEAVTWAFEVAPSVRSYKEAARLVRERYAGMWEGHAINNALFVILGIFIGGKDFTKTIGETVAMGFDNDCTGAMAGSIVGAIITEDGIPTNWTEPFQGRLQTYLKDFPEFVHLDELIPRYKKQAEMIAALKGG